MAQSQLRTGPNLVLKVSYENSDTPEKIVGYANNLTFSVIQGQKAIYTVDSPFIQELAQGAAPSMVRGTVSLYMPKGSDPIRAGLVPPTFNIETKNDLPLHVTSKTLNWRFFDRFTSELAFSINYVKVGVWTVSVTAKQHVRVNLSFEGMLYEEGVQ